VDHNQLICAEAHMMHVFQFEHEYLVSLLHF